MARNKYPQETIDKILTVSAQLFVEKGYENTSIQDILDQLGGLTKGAIYHHFKSKEDIMLSVMDRQLNVHDAQWQEVINSRKYRNGLEKLREIFRSSVYSPRQNEVFESAPKFLNNPRILALQIKSIKEESAPTFIEPVIREGMADGSITTEYPQELAEVTLLLLNLWVTPMVFGGEAEEIHRRVLFFRDMTKKMGADLVDDDMMRRFEELAGLYHKHNNLIEAE